jgi:hypothetical protein
VKAKHIVFVPGLFGWGPGELGGFPYWGGALSQFDGRPRVARIAVPAVSGVLPWLALHRNIPRAITQGSPVTTQHPQTNPPGHRKRRM